METKKERYRERKRQIQRDSYKEKERKREIDRNDDTMKKRGKERNKNEKEKGRERERENCLTDDLHMVVCPHRLRQRSFCKRLTRVCFRGGVANVVYLLEQHLIQRADASALLEWDVLHALLVHVCMLWVWVSYIRLPCLSPLQN